MPSMLEDLKGDNPKMCGFDYYNVIYCATGFLVVIMAYLYFVLEDKEVKRMVMI